MPGKKRSPFISVKCKCPICRQVNTFNYVKAKLFKPDVVDDDHHVVSYICEFKEFRHIRPENYYIWYCPTCHFTDSQESFRSEKASGKLELLRDKILIENKIREGFIQRITANLELSGEFIATDTALNLHLLSLYEHGLLSVNIRDYSRLAKLALRVAWLYRDINTLDVPLSYPPKGFASNEDFLKTLVDAWATLPLDEKSALRQAADYYKKVFDQPASSENERTEITMLFLLAELEFRLGEWKTSIGYTRRVFEILMRRRQIVRKTMDNYLKSANFKQQNFETMRSLHDWLNNMFDRVSMFREKVFEVVFEQEEEGALKVANTIDSLDPKVIYEAITNAGFDNFTAKKIAVQLVKQRKQAKQKTKKPKKKSSLWKSITQTFTKKQNEESGK